MVNGCCPRSPVFSPSNVLVPQYFLTGHQQNHLDHERRLTADHMRRLNQVLAGHLSYLEVSKVHADRENLLATAPSHGSAVGHSSSLDNAEDSNGAFRRASRRRTILQRLVRPTKGAKGEVVSPTYPFPSNCSSRKQNGTAHECSQVLRTKRTKPWYTVV